MMLYNTLKILPVWATTYKILNTGRSSSEVFSIHNFKSILLCSRDKEQIDAGNYRGCNQPQDTRTERITWDKLFQLPLPSLTFTYLRKRKEGTA